MNLPGPPAAPPLEYPLIAVGDLHGRVEWLDKLVARLRELPEWPAAKFVFLGDFPDRHPQTRELIGRVLELIAEKPGSCAVAGNHDLALTRAAGLDDRPPSEYWVRRYGSDYDHQATFRSYLGLAPAWSTPEEWAAELAELKAAMPAEHRRFLAELPWVAEAPGHLFLHCGLSRDLDCTPQAQLALLKQRRWDWDTAQPRFASRSAQWFSPDYPVWLGADRRAADNPLPFPGKVQVTGHEYVRRPSANGVRIRIDTSGGSTEPLTGCLLRGPGAEPEFVPSSGAYRGD